MKELIDKISSYNLFNYLFPGILFVVLSQKFTSYNLIQENILEGAFLYYFIGLILSRIGSLIIEPSLRYLKFIVFQPYPLFVKASKLDENVNLHSETNNMFRTLCALFLILFISIILNWIGLNIDFNDNSMKLILLGVILSVILFSYRKQTKFVYNRIEVIIQNLKEEEK